MEQSIAESDDEITLERFEGWLRTARPGSRIEYHRGYLAADREEVVLLPRPWNKYAHVIHEPIYSVGVAAMRAAEQGKVELVQKRLGPSNYRYFAVKKRKATQVIRRQA